MAISGYSAPGKEKVVQHLYEDKDLKDNRAKAPDVKESFQECERNANGMHDQEASDHRTPTPPKRTSVRLYSPQNRSNTGSGITHHTPRT